MSKPMTITEKIMAQAAGLNEISSGEIVMAQIGLVYTSEYKVPSLLNNMKKLGIQKVFDPERVVVIYDHYAVAPTAAHANMHNEVRSLAKEFNLTVYDIGRHGIMHQIVLEEGHLIPGIIAIGTDAHAPMGGAIGAVAIGMGTTDTTIAMARGETWLKVPASVKVEIQGKFLQGTMPRDIMFYFMGQKGWDGSTGEWAYQALEFTGESIKEITMDSRLAICNLAADAGAKTAIFPPDEITKQYLKGKTNKKFHLYQSDLNAEYVDHIILDVTNMEPQVACPHFPDNVKPLSEVLGTKIHVATIATCANGRLEDLHAAAQILNGRKVNQNVRMIVSPASQKIYHQALEDGTFEILSKAGVVIGHSSCGPCNGSQLVVLGDGEVCIGSLPRNFKGRLGSKNSEIYSANPFVVAASAIKGVIADPNEFL